MLTKFPPGRLMSASEAALPLMVSILIFFAFFIGNRLSLGDADIYWHLTTGQWIVDHRELPEVDIYSHSMAGRPWIAKEWLSQLLFAAAYRVGGWFGVAAIAGTAIAAAFGLLTCFLLARFSPPIALILATSACSLATPQMMARPHVFAMPLLVVWTRFLIGASEKGNAPSLLLLPLMVLWVNIHGSFLFGLALIAPFALEAACNGEKPARVLAHWVVFALLALLCTFVTPYGPGTLLAALSVLNLGGALSIVAEWRPQDFSAVSPFQMILLSGIGFALFLGIKLPPLRIALLLIMLHLALSHQRHADLLGLCAPLLLAGPLGADRVRAAVNRPIMVSVVAIGLLTVAWAATRQIEPSPRATPRAAVELIKRLNAGPVLNYYDVGGYLIFSGVPTFIDGRTELFGRDFVDRYNQAVSLQNFADFTRVLDEYKIEVTLLRPDFPAVGLLDTLQNWKRIHSDSLAVVHLRTKTR